MCYCGRLLHVLRCHLNLRPDEHRPLQLLHVFKVYQIQDKDTTEHGWQTKYPVPFNNNYQFIKFPRM